MHGLKDMKKIVGLTQKVDGGNVMGMVVIQNWNLKR